MNEKDKDKKPYKQPRLKKHGDFLKITKSKAGSKVDGGKPDTRAGGQPGSE